MNPVVLASLLLVAAPLGYLGWALLSPGNQTNKDVQENLRRGVRKAEEAQGTTHPGALARIGHAITPSQYVQKLDKLLALAGRPASLPLGKVLGAKPALCLIAAALGLLMTNVAQKPIITVLAIFLTLLGYLIPDLLLYSKGQERQKAMQLELANTLDQMLISVEAGLGFESAMQRAGETGKGPLAEELVRTLQDMQVGRSRRESYLALADRTSIPELRSFVKAIVQADAYGIALSGVLRTQAKVMRVKRRQRAEEKAMKLPVMVLFPLLFFIFPVLFIIILGPAVINVMATLSGS
ncbi:type II secretion system F family protein [Arthrobacter sp. EH-1B-1]|uniref:Type II secretion system F family protein n=1 Tax=Arthrobacter vasquezii TaxID=2977629 RepID=A0ABT6CYS2_9MICC|nr:type II secretion system F family protein [Arthrobacter vasquezii]MDF9279242.1 type II secretion system F family protein [Arthrobacter vasquezii]